MNSSVISSNRASSARQGYGGGIESRGGAVIQVGKDILKYGSPLVLLLATTACGGASTPTPNYEFVINDCNASGEVEIPAERSIQVTVPGKVATVVQNFDGSVKIGEVTVTANGGSTIGNIYENHMVVTGLGDTDQDGFQSIQVDSVCPAPPPSTLVPSTPAE